MIKPSFQPTLTQEIAPGVLATKFSGLWYLPQTPHEDNRGFYAEVTRVPEVEAVLKQPFIIKQVNHSHSLLNVARGFHAENWNKLLTVVSGTAFAALADIRPESPTFGQVETFLLGAGEQAIRGSLFVSKGIANSFCVVEGPVDYLYFVDQLYANRDTSGDVALSLFDPDLAVEWPLPKEQMIYSERDGTAISLRQKFPHSFVA
jgi:dTDP-4-dehydrorhamnose 3,5-epimerase